MITKSFWFNVCSGFLRSLREAKTMRRQEQVLTSWNEPNHKPCLCLSMTYLSLTKSTASYVYTQCKNLYSLHFSRFNITTRSSKFQLQKKYHKTTVFTRTNIPMMMKLYSSDYMLCEKFFTDVFEYENEKKKKTTVISWFFILKIDILWFKVCEKFTPMFGFNNFLTKFYSYVSRNFWLSWNEK